MSLSFHIQWTCLQFHAALAIAAHPRRHSLHSQQTYKRCVYYTRSSHHPYAGTQRQDPVAVADTAIAVQIEKQRVAEALAARDNVVDRLKYACTSVQQKEATILRLQRELEALRRSSTPRILTPSASPGADIRLCSEFADLSSPGASAYLLPPSPDTSIRLSRPSTPAVTDPDWQVRAYMRPTDPITPAYMRHVVVLRSPFVGGTGQ